MIIYRIAMRPYIDLSGAGGLYHSGRWHTKGHPVIYAGANIETCLLEIAVNNYLTTARRIGVVMEISIPEKEILNVKNSPYLSHDFRLDDLWRLQPEKKRITQNIGNQFLKEGKYLALRVPSITIESPTAHNFLINPLHPAITKVSYKVRNLSFDSRLTEK